MSDIEFDIIYPRIHVYRNSISEPQKFIDLAQKSEKWEGWYTFGRMLPMMIERKEYQKFPTLEEFVGQEIPRSNDEAQIFMVEKLEPSFYEKTKHFIEYYGLDFPNWVHASPSFNEYNANDGISENYAMNYHTDFIPWEKDAPGLKACITTTFYFNDDYEGGEICFKINDHYISHKPRAGDLIVFPSDAPYYHGVAKAYGNKRYMARSFWYWQHSGSEEWLAGQQKYGEEKWKEMEMERIKQERVGGGLGNGAEFYHKFKGRDNGKFSSQ